MDGPLRRVHLANFDVEEQWTRDEPGLPAPALRSAVRVVAATSELALLLGGPDDRAVLKTAPEPGLLAQLDRAGLAPPPHIDTDSPDPTRPVTADALGNPAVISRLRELALQGFRLAPHGLSADEVELGLITGLEAPFADAAAAKRVNGKVYGRRLCAALGIATPPGWECETLDELAALADPVRARLEQGAVVGFKSAYGVSGKGIMVCDRPGKFDQLVRLLTRRGERSGDGRCAAVIEEWQDKRTDINYHFTIDDDGEAAFDYALEAVTENGTHRGHRLPGLPDRELRDRLAGCAHQLGERLAAAGYRGPVGVDAIICADGTLFPVLEINARNNMSTYLGRVIDRMDTAGAHGTAVQIDFARHSPWRYEELDTLIGDLALDPDWRRGFLTTCFATVNAAADLADSRGRFRGRLHGVAAGRTTAEADAVEQQVRHRIGEMEQHHG